MIRLSKSFVGQLEIDAVASVLNRGFLGMGEEVGCFEQELAAYLGVQAVVCVNTGTAALHLALQALEIGIGDEVLVPSLTFVASFQAISATGAVPIACDVKEQDGLLDLVDARRRVTGRTRAIMPVHYASFTGDMQSVYDFADEFNLRVVEDAAHAFGCRTTHGYVGSYGDVICFSFDGIKNITSGEGGAIICHDSVVLDRVRDARLLGVMRDSENRYRGERSWDFDVKEQGWRYHMSDLMAAIGRVQLRRFENELAPKRRSLASTYRRLLSEEQGWGLFSNTAEGMVPHIFPIRIFEEKRDLVRIALENAGIQTGIHYKPNHLLARFGNGQQNLPVVERLYAEILTLPLHPQLDDSDCERTVEVIKSTLRQAPS